MDLREREKNVPGKAKFLNFCPRQYTPNAPSSGAIFMDGFFFLPALPFELASELESSAVVVPYCTPFVGGFVPD